MMQSWEPVNSAGSERKGWTEANVVAAAASTPPKAGSMAQPPELWSKPIENRDDEGLKGRYRVLLAGMGDLDEAGDLCIKVRICELLPLSVQQLCPRVRLL